MSSNSLFSCPFGLILFPEELFKGCKNWEFIWRHIKVKRYIIHAHSDDVCPDTAIISTRIVFIHFSTQQFPEVTWAVIVPNVSRLYIVTITCCHVHEIPWQNMMQFVKIRILQYTIIAYYNNNFWKSSVNCCLVQETPNK